MLNAIRFTSNTIRQARPTAIGRTLKYRLMGAPDGYPLPPTRLVFEAVIHGWASVYYDSGKLVMDAFRQLLAKNDIDLTHFERVMDFGCGSGRLLRHLADLKGEHPQTATMANEREKSNAAELHGTDISDAAIAWSRTHLPFATFQVNKMHPPLDFPDDYFDWIYAHSVFCTWGAARQIEWLPELRRILKPGGILLFTQHGTQYVAKMTPTDKVSYEAGQVVTIDFGEEGSNNFGSFASPQFVQDTLLPDFEVLDWVAGQPRDHLRQDIYIARKPAATMQSGNLGEA